MKRILISVLLGTVIIVLNSCENGSDVGVSAENGSSPTGQGGSMARFALNGDYLYCVDQSTLKVVNVADQKNITVEREINLGLGIETIFPKDTLLFIGSDLGMMIYDISEPANPIFLSEVTHVFSCDPVVADNRYAYVTLSTGRQRCWRGVNELQIIDIENVLDPRLVETYDMTNPLGLGIDNGALFVCDDGLKVYDASDVHNIQLKHEFSIPAFDVIPSNGVLMVIATDGLYQYQYDGESIELLSQINYTGK